MAPKLLCAVAAALLTTGAAGSVCSAASGAATSKLTPVSSAARWRDVHVLAQAASSSSSSRFTDGDPADGDDPDEPDNVYRRQSLQPTPYSYSYAGQQQFQQQQQQYQQQQQQQPPAVNPLMKQTGTATVGFLFVMLIWRSLAAYELADQFNVGIYRVVAVTPTVIILVANLAGFLINMMKPLNFKNTLKAVLALNVGRECIELLYNAMMLVVNQRRTGLQIIPTEIYLGRFFMNLWWLSLCLTFSKSRWVLAVTPPSPPPQQQQGFPQQQEPRMYERRGRGGEGGPGHEGETYT